jgi:hypothetical protein
MGEHATVERLQVGVEGEIFVEWTEALAPQLRTRWRLPWTNREVHGGAHFDLVDKCIENGGRVSSDWNPAVEGAMDMPRPGQLRIAIEPHNQPPTG